MTEREYLLKIGKNITRIRKEKGLTIKELGFRCDIEKSNLIPIEKGRINATALTLLKIAAALDVEVKGFFDF
jgi:transcriptional regulator with XRE-family HTH domain